GIVPRADAGEPGTPIVVAVTFGGPAQQAGLQPGDRLLAVAGRPLAGQAEMVEQLKRSGDECRLAVERRGRMLEITMCDGVRPRTSQPSDEDHNDATRLDD
ncbi:MAG: PDZ domain-containing protein, partial [Planctomycetota bacterium]|nr:PDZ domain-containing protein [Planctomycetota bacterium]